MAFTDKRYKLSAHDIDFSVVYALRNLGSLLRNAHRLVFSQRR